MTATDTNPIPLNRLARETSPYLLQHARNPVEWYPWGEEAFAKARREGKPIFLSVGYSTCHWCHVMAHESFEDPAVARIMNRFFVCVKVDREQRPEIDRLYMSYVQSATHGRGGWPMSVWLTPDLKPFYGGTYFPPDDRYGFPGFVRVLESLAEAWRTARPKLEAAGDEAIRLLASAAARAPSAEQVGEDTLDAAAAAFLSEYDARYGGFGGAPKFPRPAVFTFLLDHSARTGEPSARDAVLHTLRRMADGGICDQLGGGFHRYATDEAWQIPHFEKMLYDQAQLVCAYLDAWLATCDPIFADIARATLDYVRRDLAGADGGFLSAEDADSPLPDAAGSSGEGAFYTWTAREVREVLRDEEGKRFSQAFGLDRPGNVIDGRHVLAVTGDEARKLLARHRDALLDMRASRPRPHRDDKVLTAWNGLMLGACARAYQVLERPDDLASAQRAAAFVRSRLFDAASGSLHRSWRDGRASGEGFAEDYAFLIHGLLALYEADFDPAHLDWALALQEKLDTLFWDEANGGYFCSADGAADVLVRMKETHDGAEPAAGSIAALNLLWLAALTDEAKYRERADALLAFFGRRLREQPESLPLMLAARARSLCPPQQIVIAGARDAEDTRALLRVVRQHPSRNRVVLLADSGPGQTVLTRLQPALGQMRPLGGRAAAYVCQAFTCRAPVADPEALGALLKQCNEELGMRN